MKNKNKNVNSYFKSFDVIILSVPFQPMFKCMGIMHKLCMPIIYIHPFNLILCHKCFINTSM